MVNFVKDAPLVSLMQLSVQGQLDFCVVLFVPCRAPFRLVATNMKRINIKLHFLYVFIIDEGDELIPVWYSLGVDSEDFPLKFSRETLLQFGPGSL